MGLFNWFSGPKAEPLLNKRNAPPSSNGFGVSDPKGVTSANLIAAPANTNVNSQQTVAKPLPQGQTGGKRSKSRKSKKSKKSKKAKSKSKSRK